MGKAIILENLDFSRKNLGVVTIRSYSPVTGISISAEDTFVGEFLQLRIVYTPVNTSEVGVIWSIDSGDDYATIDSYGKLTVLSAADGDDVVVKAVSVHNNSIYATKTITVTYDHQSSELTGITINGSSTVTGKQANYSVSYTPSDTWKTGVTWSVISGSEYCSITNSGVLAVKEGANSSPATIRAVSTYDSTIYADKQLTLTYLDAIVFEDPVVKAICVANWDTDGNGEISQLEAKAVTKFKNQFYGNTEITSFDEFRFFTNLTTIDTGGRGFKDCSNLESIILPASLTDLQGTYGYFFLNCSSLTSVDVTNVTNLGGFCFQNCTSLARITLNGTMTSIPGHTFDGCSSLSDVNIPSTVTYIGNSAFLNCTSLVNLTLPSVLTTIAANAFSGCKALELSSIPSTVTGTIGEKAFNNCQSITISSVPEGVTSLGASCFYRCYAITELTLPSTLTTLASRALFDLSHLTKLICLATTPPTAESTTFNGSWKIYVPDESVDAYKAATNWPSSRIHPISELEGDSGDSE